MVRRVLAIGMSSAIWLTEEREDPQSIATFFVQFDDSTAFSSGLRIAHIEAGLWWKREASAGIAWTRESGGVRVRRATFPI